MPVYRGPATLSYQMSPTLRLDIAVTLAADETAKSWTAQAVPLTPEDLCGLKAFPCDTLTFPDGTEMTVCVGEPDATGMCMLREPDAPADTSASCPACPGAMEWTNSYDIGPDPALVHRIFTCSVCGHEAMRPHREAPWVPVPPE